MEVVTADGAHLIEAGGGYAIPREVNDSMLERHYTQADGRRLFEEERARRLADPEYRAIYEEEAQKKELWLQLVEARQAAGLTQEQLAHRLGVSQAQVARIEKRGYDAYTLTTLRRYVEALGDGYRLEVNVRQPQAPEPPAYATASR